MENILEVAVDMGLHNTWMIMGLAAGSLSWFEQRSLVDNFQ